MSGSVVERREWKRGHARSSNMEKTAARREGTMFFPASSVGRTRLSLEQETH